MLPAYDLAVAIQSGNQFVGTAWPVKIILDIVFPGPGYFDGPARLPALGQRTVFQGWHGCGRQDGQLAATHEFSLNFLDVRA